MPAESVLIIEDDATLLRGLKDNFEIRGYHVQSAGDGESGLAAALSGKPDLVLLDIMLPKLNGFEVCRKIREAELDMPIIMLTAKGQEEDIVRGLNLCPYLRRFVSRRSQGEVLKPGPCQSRPLHRLRALHRRQERCPHDLIRVSVRVLDAKTSYPVVRRVHHGERHVD